VPLDATGQFNGTMMLVSQEDTIEKFVKVVNGYIALKGDGKIPFWDISSGFAQTDSTSSDRDGKPKVRCPQFGSNNINIDWGWWNEFWKDFGTVAGNIWDAINGSSESYSGSYFFPGGQLGWTTPEGYQQPGGGGIFDQQFSGQMATCAAINEYILSIGEIPPGYSQTDLDFCMLVNEAGLNGAESMCLFTQYGHPQQEEIIKYWDASPKDIATADKLKAYINGKCNGSFAILLTHLLKDKFFLEQHPIDLMEQIKNTCGFSSYDGPEWYDAFNSGLSQCTKEVIVDDWFDLTAAEKTLLLNDQALFDKIGSFITSNGGDAASKDAAELLVQLIAQGKYPSFKEEDFPPGVFVQLIMKMAWLKILHPSWDMDTIFLQAVKEVMYELHIALDICGLLPVVGEPCDLTNGVLFIIEGDPLNASLSFAATLPIAGWISTGGKYAHVAVKKASTGVQHLLKLTNDGGLITFGERTGLREVMEITDAANDAHHLIPWSRQDHELVQLAAKANNTPFHMNHPKNGRELKRFRFDQQDGVHGNHPQYNEKVRINLNEILSQLETQYGGLNNIPPDVASQRLRDFQNQLGNLIDQNPTTKINDLNF
jgi:hypothetical protein